MMADTLSFPHIRQCPNVECGFRYPVTEFDRHIDRCPKCGSTTEFIMPIPNNGATRNDSRPLIRLSFLLDNLRSVFNVGSIFRSADGCGIVDHLYLCGTTPTPDHIKMAKTSLGAEKAVAWSYHLNALRLVEKLAQSGKTLVSLEMTARSIPFRNFIQESNIDDVIFIVGNEVTGVDPAILTLAGNHIHIPMHGMKESLNVAIAASILCYAC